jgi:5-methylcytosine-specific restriction endonuclease McrA
MTRNHDRNRNGGSWNDSQKKSVWKKGEIIFGFDPSVLRNDKCEERIKWVEHGNRNSYYGWEIDHINSVSNGGSDSIDNLQPLHWKNNTDKADNLDWTCSVASVKF